MQHAQVIFITGASSGLGQISAQMLARRGHIVYGTSRKKERLDGKVQLLQMDVTDTESIRRTVKRVIEEQGRIDVLINNAGIGISGALELATPEEIDMHMRTNFLGVVYTCQAVLPYMRKQRSGKIINVSSLGGRMGIPFQGFYSASKFAVEGYSEALATETHPFHIRICLVEPGDSRTNFTANRNVSEATLRHPDYGKAFASTLRTIEQEEKHGSPPYKFGKAVCRLVECKHPRFRTQVGNWMQVGFARCKKWLPARWMLAGLRFFYQGGSKKV